MIRNIRYMLDIPDKMNPHLQLKYRRVSPPFFIGVLFSFCILFLQAGFTYYWSFQMLALVLLLTVILKNRPLVVNLAPMLLSTAIFAVFLSLTAFNVPLAVSQNSKDIFVTSIGVVGYATMIISAPNIAFKSPENVLYFFRFVSAATLIAIVSLICVTDLSIVPFLTREILVLQNTTLIDNFITLEVLADDFAMRSRLGLEPNIDLFYGEQSFLSVVIFACIASSIISHRLLQAMSLSGHERARDARQGKLYSFANYNSHGFVIVLGLASMVYIQAFSSFFYAVLICVSLVLSVRHRRFHLKLTLARLLIVSLVVILLGGIVWSAFDYYAHRLNTVSDSISFEQRFSSIFDFGFQEYLIGISDAAKIPKYGFQNGILYIIGISGLGGMGLIIFLSYRIYILARPFRLSLLAIMCIFAIFSQNGGIFSPNKVVLLSLVLIPLSCANRIRLSKRAIKGGNTDQSLIAHSA